MLRLILTLFIILTAFLDLGCFNNSDTPPSDRPQIIGKLKLYTFSPDHEYFLGYAQPFILPHSTSIRDTVDNLGQHLAENYFYKTYTSKLTGIHFEILSIDEISTPSRPLRIAMVNMVDTDRDAMSSFFQGSTGGQTTFCMLAATFMQPHLSPPLLDGLVLLYNGEILPELDHINLSGILIPRAIQQIAKRAIHRTEREAVISRPDKNA
jgi:hypothetical protein